MKTMRLSVAIAALAFTGAATAQLTDKEAAGGARQDDVGTVLKPAAEIHFEAARKAAGTEFLGPLQLCNGARPASAKWKMPPSDQIRGAGPTLAALLRMNKTVEQAKADGIWRDAPPVTRVFDNFYFLGLEDVTAWALDTRDGIIIIDGLNNHREWVDRIEPGMRKVGLDPARIKYVVVSHGHGDHFGGAAYLKQKYGARVLMSEADWKIAPHMIDKPFFDPPPAQDLIARDGHKLTLGGETISLFITPGHTPGTLSMLIPVRDQGRRRVASLWGGTGFNFVHSPARFKGYSDSAKRFLKLAEAAGAEIPLSPHGEYDNAINKIRLMEQRGPNGPNPFVMGKDGVRRFMTILSECALGYGAQMDVGAVSRAAH